MEVLVLAYNVIYADPPWNYNSKHTGGSMNSGAAQKYNVLTQQDIIDIIRNVGISDDSVIFLWSTTPMLISAVHIIQELGYTYKTLITWIKTGRLGMGYWVRVQTEFLLLGVKGNIRPFKSSMRNHILEKPGKHSAKPDIFYEIIETLTKNVENRKLIEIFARKRRVGWESIGDELESSEHKDR